MDERLKLKNQICFPLYSVANLIVRNYKPLLDKLDLTYTQYITMMVLWEKQETNEKELGKQLHLKSNTLTPLLQKLMAKGYIEMKKNDIDARNLVITLTPEGQELYKEALCVPEAFGKSLHITQEEALFLYKILYKILEENENENL